MLNKMVKLKNKKAFTLIEMMAVVAIVAILVAILVPVIGNSTVKSRAATNAANLRAVEAELATLKVSNPECFVAATDQAPGKELVWLAELIYGDGAGKYYLSKIEADGGTLVFYENNLTKTGTSVSQSGVPTSVSVKADTGMDVAEGMQMVVFLSGNEIIAAYAGTDGVYFDKDCFAEVAETGKFTGTGGTTSGGIVDWAGKNLCKLGIHDWGKSNNDGTHSCKRNCGAKENCDFKNGECRTCHFTCSNHVWQKDDTKHWCTTCGATAEHTYGALSDACKTCGYKCDHKCGYSEYRGSMKCKHCNTVCVVHEYSSYVDGTYHKCATCGKQDEHSGTLSSLGNSCVCGATKVTTTETKICTKGNTTEYGTAGKCSECGKHHKEGTSKEYTKETTTWEKNN